MYAGFMIAQSILDSSAEDLHRQVNVNVIGLTLCAKEAINQMRQNKVDDAHVINVSDDTKHITTAELFNFIRVK